MRPFRSSLLRADAGWLLSRAGRRAWVCPSCRGQKQMSTASSQGSQSLPSSSLAAPSLSSKPYYVSTPIFYVNASPHIGHLHSMVLADVFKRWQTLRGRPAILSTGTDEHGIKVQRAALQAGISPEPFCAANSSKFRELAKAAGLSTHDFIRTTDDAHVKAVQAFWAALKEKEYIYESKHEGWYCVSDECFYPESMVQRRFVPLTGKVVMASVETGNEVEWTEEKNYHFRMTALRERLLEFYKENPDWIVPASRMKEVVSWVTDNLEDLSISRPVSRLSWGIPVPDDPSQTIYVWVDALVNYVTIAGYPSTPQQLVSGGWPADLHVVGKDIIRFHGIYWPALLLALDLPLPRRILSHAHWTLGHKKISKSAGNGVLPSIAMERWGVDVVRYFLMADGGIENDSDYENSLIAKRYKKDLQASLGNSLARITRSKLWTVRRAVERERDGVRRECVLGIDEVVGKVEAAMDALRPGLAIRHVMELLAEAGRQFSDARPWDLVASNDRAKADPIIYDLAEALRVSAILLLPVMPTKMTELLDILSVDPSKRSLEYARRGADFDYGTEMNKKANEKGEGWAGKSTWTTLFPPPVLEE